MTKPTAADIDLVALIDGIDAHVSDNRVRDDDPCGLTVDEWRKVSAILRSRPPTTPQWCECSDRMSGGVPCPPGKCPNVKPVEPSEVVELSRRVREGRGLLHRLVKYVREDRAETSGSTRLARLVETVDDYLRRTANAADILRAEACAAGTHQAEALGMAHSLESFAKLCPYADPKDIADAREKARALVKLLERLPK